MAPEIAVVVASHDRPLRLRCCSRRWPTRRSRATASRSSSRTTRAGPETEALLRDHALAAGGHAAPRARAPGSSPPGAQPQRRLARRPSADRSPSPTTTAARRASGWPTPCAPRERHPGAIVQGATLPDPDERAIAYAPVHHTQQHRAAHGRGPRPATSSTRARCSSGSAASTSDALVGEDAALAASRAARTASTYVGDARRPDLPRRRARSRCRGSCARCGAGRTCRCWSRSTREMRRHFPLRPVLEVRRTHGCRWRCSGPRWRKRTRLPLAAARPALGQDVAARAYGPGKRNLVFRLRQAATPRSRSTPPRWRCWPAAAVRHRAPLL